MKILIAGDFCPRDRISEAFESREYDNVLGEVRSLTENADYSIVNLECPIVADTAVPIEKQGPNLRCSDNAVRAIKWAGFDCVTLANNHFLDYGEEGVTQTLSALDANGIEYVGGGKNLKEAAKILYKEIHGKRLAIINCCEHEFSIATETTAGSNPLNAIQQYYTIQETKKNADKVLVIIHGGHEHFQLPSPRMVETYRFFVDAGADAIVNHHQHCFSGYEVYNGKPIFYGLGNFCFDDKDGRSSKWNEGYMVVIDFFSSSSPFCLYPYVQCDKEPNVHMLPQETYSERINLLSSIIANPAHLKEETDKYYALCAEDYGNIFEPLYNNRYYLWAKNQGLLPSLINKKRKLAAENFILCESHRDKLSWWLQHN